MYFLFTFILYLDEAQSKRNRYVEKNKIYTILF